MILKYLWGLQGNRKCPCKKEAEEIFSQRGQCDVKEAQKIWGCYSAGFEHRGMSQGPKNASNIDQESLTNRKQILL